MMDVFITHGPFIKAAAWKFLFFGMGWQFLRWFILTRWLIKTIEHTISYSSKVVIEQGLYLFHYLLRFITENGAKVVQEIWMYRFGKIILVLLGLYCVYIIIF